MPFRRGIVALGAMTLGLLVLMPLSASAQSAISGVARDTSGAVLPGVSVEVASPVLIEKVRTAVTDEAGRYTVVDLRPGLYSVTFSLAGFSTYVRDGIELPVNFTATVNGDMTVGAIEESVTVSGASPVVDLQSPAQNQILARAVIDAIPTGKSVWSIGQLVPGVALSGQDVGGSRGMQQLTMTVNGSDSRDTAVQVDGMNLNSFEDGVQQYFNDMMFEEMNYQTSAMSAETSGAGVRLNMIPKEGGNQTKGTVYFGLSPGSLVGDNYTPELQARGLNAPGKMKINRDLSGAVGGTIVRDRLWWFFSGRRWGVDQYVNNSFYNLDPTHRTWKPDYNSQVVDDNMIKSGVVRLTYRQGSHKFASYLDRIFKFRGHECGSNSMEEVCGIRYPRIYYTAQAKYTGTWTNRLLFESGLSVNNETYSTGDSQPSVKDGDIPRTEITGISAAASGLAGGVPAGAAWGAPTTRNFRWPIIMQVASASAAYVTGTHSFKTGIQWGWGEGGRTMTTGGGGLVGLVQRYRVGVPSDVIVYNTPMIDNHQAVYDIGIFVQDTWTLNRLSISPGIRFELFDSKYPVQTAPAGRFIAARTFAEQPKDQRPHWKDALPRIGVVYDLFGDNTTAVKASWGKYVTTYHGSASSLYNPMVLTSDTRTWNDGNRDDIAQGDLSCDLARTWSTATAYVPGCEIGAPTRDIGSRPSARPAANYKRPGSTEISASVQRQLAQGVSVTFAYTRRDYNNIIWRQNLAVHPVGTPVGTGYTTATVPNPIDASAPLTVYNLNPALNGLVDFVDDNSKNNTRVYNAYDLSFQSRVFGGTVFGGVGFGQSLTSTCDVTDPNYISATAAGLKDCDQNVAGMPFQSTFKLSTSYPLPYGIKAGGSFRSIPGGLAANGADPSINRNYNISQATFRTATGQALTQTSVIVPLLVPGTEFLPRINTADVRFSKVFSLGGSRTIQGQFDIFNALNSNVVTGTNQTHGASYGNVTSVLVARVMQMGFTFNF